MTDVIPASCVLRLRGLSFEVVGRVQVDWVLFSQHKTTIVNRQLQHLVDFCIEVRRQY